MTAPSKSQPTPKLTIESKGAKGDLRATACVREMLEAFGLEGHFVLTTNYGDDRGRAERYGIKVKHHTHSGVSLVIQPEKGTSRFYDSYLALQGTEHYQLASILLAKLIGQKYFRKGEWKDPSKVIQFPEKVVTVPPAISTEQSVPLIDNKEDVKPPENNVDDIIRKYAREQEGRLLILDAVWQTFQMGSFTTSDFCKTVGTMYCPGVSHETLKKILKALVTKPFIRQEKILDTPTYVLSDAGFRFLNQLMYGGALDEPTTSAKGPSQSIKDQIAELQDLVATRQAAEKELARVEDDAKLVSAELVELKKQTDSAQVRLGEIMRKAAKLEETLARRDLIEAQKTLAEIKEKFKQ